MKSREIANSNGEQNDKLLKSLSALPELMLLHLLLNLRNTLRKKHVVTILQPDESLIGELPETTQ